MLLPNLTLIMVVMLAMTTALAEAFWKDGDDGKV